MTYAKFGGAEIDYQPCRYGGSRVMFRGPRRSLRGDYLAFFGGTDTFGRYIAEPFAAKVEQALEMPAVNLGALNAGLDLYASDPAVMNVADRARAVVFQVLGAHNMSNRFYLVHPRRNDRFLRASDDLQTLYPEVDFTEFHFNRHMLGALRDLSAERFDQIRTELQAAWVARMKQLLGQLRGPVVLLWFAEQTGAAVDTPYADGGPVFVDAEMVAEVARHTAALVEVVPSVDARAQGTQDMIFLDAEAEAASRQLNAAAHREAAAKLVPVIGAVLGRAAA